MNKKNIVNLFLFILLGVGNVYSAEEKMIKSGKSNKADNQQASPEQKPLILVNGESLTSQSYIYFLQGNPSIVSRATSSDAGKADALRELVASHLLKKALFDEGYLKMADGEAPPQKEIIEAYEKLAEKHFPLPPKADENAAYEYYQAHKDEYGIPSVTRLGEIYIKHPEGADKAVISAAKVRAEKVLKRLESGEKFEDIASEETDNPIAKVTRGDIGFQQVDNIPWLREAIKSIKVGDHTGIVETPTGFIILEITDIRPALLSPYANVRDKVMQALREEGQKKQRDSYVKELSKKSKIELIEPEIKRLFPNGMFP